MSEKSSSSLKSFVLGAVIGAVIGTAATLLYMPQTGKKLRRQLKEKGKKLKKELDKFLQESQSLAENLKENLGKAAKTNEEDEINSPTADTSEAEESPKASSKKETPAKKKPRFFKGI